MKRRLIHQAAYVHLTTNNTIEGTYLTWSQWRADCGSMSSNIPLAAQYRVEVLVWLHGAQEEYRTCPMTVVIIRGCSMMSQFCLTLDYLQADSDSLQYTTDFRHPVASWSLTGSRSWVVQQKWKSAIVKNLVFCTTSLSGSDFTAVQSVIRTLSSQYSFVSPSPGWMLNLTKRLQQRDSKNIKGHRSVGGMSEAAHEKRTKTRCA